MIEGLIRGGVSLVYNKRLAVANNKYLQNFNPKAPSAFIVMIDANNLYGGIMEKFPLPLNNFEYTDGNWDPEIEKAFILKKRSSKACWRHLTIAILATY